MDISLQSSAKSRLLRGFSWFEGDMTPNGGQVAARRRRPPVKFENSDK
jgi:hypothetical protein